MSFNDILHKPFKYSYNNITTILVVINVVIFIFTVILPEQVIWNLGLHSRFVFTRGFVWQVATYMFVHSPFGFAHILFNMLALFLFGSLLERRLGSKEFLLFYLVCGTLTGILSLFLNMNVIGASGAIFAVLLAAATFFPEQRVLLFFVLPVKAPVAVIVFTGLSLVFLFTDRSTNIAHFAHLGGIVFGFLYIIVRFRINPIKVFIDSLKP